MLIGITVTLNGCCTNRLEEQTNMSPFFVTSESFIAVLLSRPTDVTWTPTKEHRCKSHFDLSPALTAKLWNHLAVNCDPQGEGWRPECPMNASHFLKKCNMEDVDALFAGHDEKTVHKWNVKVVEATASLNDLVCFSDVSCDRRSCPLH